MTQIIAPWTDEQVEMLNVYQNLGYVHPFTCPDHADDRHNDHPFLRATVQGWVCDGCGYTQNWAHEFMTQLIPVPEFLKSS